LTRRLLTTFTGQRSSSTALLSQYVRTNGPKPQQIGCIHPLCLSRQSHCVCRDFYTQGTLVSSFLLVHTLCSDFNFRSSDSSVVDEKTNSQLEKGHATVAVESWEGYLDDPLPDKKQSKIVRDLRSIFFSVYRRVFSVVFAVNMSLFIWACSRYREEGHDRVNAKWLAEVTIGNLFAAILIRQDHIINLLFFIFCSIPTSYTFFVHCTMPITEKSFAGGHCLFVGSLLRFIRLVASIPALPFLGQYGWCCLWPKRLVK
jgi:hypothetical protein